MRNWGLSLFRKGFYGGVHGATGEKKSLGKLESLVMPAPERVYISMAQHTGAPARPLVQVGDEVLVGQPVGEATGFISATVHASVSGKIVALGPYLQISGLHAPTVVIENDGLYTPYHGYAPMDWETSTAEALLARTRECGLVGMGGAAFPLSVKLSVPEGKRADMLLLNGCECEPYLASDSRLMQERPEAVITGIRIAMRILGVSRARIGVEDDKPEAIRALAAVARPYSSIDIRVLKTRYPQGSEKQLIQALAHRQVPSGKLPIDVGAPVCNVGTMAALCDAVTKGLPPIRRLVTFSGGALKSPRVLSVVIGTLVRDALRFAGGVDEGMARLLCGGPMMGIALYDEDVPIVKATSGLLALTADETFTPGGPRDCIHCGRCMICPMGLEPMRLADLLAAHEYETAVRYRIMDCMECGACTYRCPARRPITHMIRAGKREIQAQNRK